uniref:1-acyl-sn-glycerol-3-phosphate acyltransferase n=1 Tax=uncultured Draconibacterium sp. TaxID=1573823 RepID=UPI0032180C58
MKGFCKFWLKVLGWKAIGSVAPENKCIIIGAPHTSAWDFVISWLFYTSIGGLANVLIKKEFFFWPVGYFVKKMGGLPIDRSKGANVIRQTIQLINESEKIHLALTPEGTRDFTVRWKAGFHIIAKETGIPVYLGYFDWGRKEISIGNKFELTDNANNDINRMKDFYRERGIKGKFPEQFSTDC